MEEIENGENIDESTIGNQEEQNSTFSTIINNYNELKDIIHKISIKNENELLNEKIMEIYNNYQFFQNFIGNNHNICDYFFCENCSKNFCDICSNNCIEKHQNKLIKLKDKIDFYKNEIEKIIQEYYKNKIIDEPIKKLENDIIVIKLIIDSNYNNYFHYKIIENFYKYMKRKYDINDQILIEYKIESNKSSIKIFGFNFVKNNEGKCFIIYEDIIFELTEYFELKNKAKNNILKIKLIGINNVFNMSDMFYNCNSLISLPDISKWNTNNATNMSYMFYNCSSLISLPDISKWNTSNVIGMSWMFYNCSLLISLPDISKWNTNNVTYMSRMFYNCSSLISLPDISKWNTNYVTNMDYMFYNCTSLISLPDIEIWNTSNVFNMSYIFYNCSSLISLPDISKWNINNDTNMSYMFYNCSSLISLPDISKWNTNNDMSDMFSNCFSLIHLNDI